MQQLRLALLGPLQAWRGDVPLALGPVREQALLAALLLRPGTTASRQQLLDGVWGTEQPGTGAKVLPVYVHRLRKCLDGAGGGPADSVILTDRGGYRFVPRDVWVDAARMTELAAEATAARDGGDPEAAADAWSRSLELFRGEPLAGIPGPFAQGERLRLTEYRLALVQDKVDCELRLGRQVAAIGELFALTEAHPYHEALAALLMRALYVGNRQADALEVFAKVRRRLVADQGAEPGAELRQVHEAVLRGDDAQLIGTAVRPEQRRPQAAHPVGARRERRVRNELPVGVGNFIGRDRELALLGAPAADEGGVTVRAVDGMAGVGKTALVVRAARAGRERYPDGCLFVDLHGYREDRGASGPQRVLRRLLRAVGADEGEDCEDLDELAASWRTATAGLRLLLVLDDASGAEQVRPLLPAGPGSMLLVTSRQRLTGLDVDRRVSLAPLDMDDAVGLLSRIVGGSGAPHEDGAIRRLAGLCDQLPLALRIAGARLQNRPSWALRSLVDRLADDERRLGELSVEDRSVEAAFQLSYDQLPVAAQRAFRALGLSPTVEVDAMALAAMLDWTRPEAEHLLTGLVDASLVQQVAADRYRLHDLVAVYARRVAAGFPAEVAAVREGVFRLYVAAARRSSDWGPSAFPTGPTPGSAPFADWEEATNWLDAVGAELVDVVGHAVGVGKPDEACWLAEGLFDYLTRQGRFHECRTTLETVLPLVTVVADRRMASELRTCLGMLYGLQGRYAQAHPWLTQALEISRSSGDLLEQARALGNLATFANLQGQVTDSMGHFAEVAEIVAKLDDEWLTAVVTATVGDMHHQLGEHDRAYTCYTEAIVLAERVESPRLLGKTLLRLGILHLDLGRTRDAVDALRRAADLAVRLRDVPLYAAVLGKSSTAEACLGNVERAADLGRLARGALNGQFDAASEALHTRLVWNDVAAEDLAGSREFFERSVALPDAGANRARISSFLDGIRRQRDARGPDS
ncbi:tetratricopeptide repeat protein [Streptomyces albulus]|uniref:AfsR/SARP family transcriptional regulator n=1 Tax=Streptomyces noursei TaxID=1971 RepID=UPI001F44BB15|nr:BTAD domain-containing putative transcriptional regulator [Streptomyces noursei]MCE4941576.1 tetratricopeptide repeat protein [Streptomyces noursei]